MKCIEMFFDAISECPHVNVEEVDDGSIPTAPQIVEPSESNGVTLTVPVPVIAIQRYVLWTATLLHGRDITFCTVFVQIPNNTSSFFYFAF